MTYRKVQDKDLNEISSLLLEHGIEYDITRKIPLGFVAEDENGIVGFIFAHPAMLIEPFICKNAMAAFKLNSMMEGAISAVGISVSLAHVNNTLDAELVKSGYEKIERYSVYKKVSE